MRIRLFLLFALLAAASAIGLGFSARASRSASTYTPSQAAPRSSAPAPSSSQPLLNQEPPPLCPAGNAPVATVFSEDFEAAAIGWTESTTYVFSTTLPYTWALTGTLPGGRPGSAFFASGNASGQCDGSADDASRLMSLFSPVITLPVTTTVARMAFDHSFVTEFPVDGGNVRVSVNGGPYHLVDPADFTFNTYNANLTPAADGNTNPLAGQPAFTGSSEGPGAGVWGQSVIDLSGHASPGDAVRLRFDFGANGCGGIDGWYVDEVKVYYCENQIYDPTVALSLGGLQASALAGSAVTATLGITNNGDAALAWSVVEESPAPDVPLADVIADGSFEGGSPNPDWTEYSLQGTPQGLSIICSAATCLTDRAHTGSWYAMFGNYNSSEEEGLITQTVNIPVGEADLSFYLLMEVQDAADIGSLQVLIDDTPVFTATQAVSSTYLAEYMLVSVDASAYADGNQHEVVFHEVNPAGNPGNITFFVDDVALAVTTAPGCAPLDIPWLSASPLSGSILFANTQEVDFTFDTASLTAGEYTGTVCINTNDPARSLITLPVTLTVGEAAQAAFTPSATMVAVGVPVTFTNSSTGTEPISYLWDFGDDITSTLANPSHAYGEPGVYTVTLTAMNEFGAGMAAAAITVGNSPTAGFTPSPASAGPGQTIHFTNTTTGTLPITYTWDFDDGTTSAETDPDHSFAAPGQYSVTLASASIFGSDTFTLDITISDAALPPGDIFLPVMRRD